MPDETTREPCPYPSRGGMEAALHIAELYVRDRQERDDEKGPQS